MQPQNGVSSKMKIELPYDPAIPLLCIYTKVLKARFQTNTYTPVSLFTKTKRWKQPKYPLTDEWINTW